MTLTEAIKKADGRGIKRPFWVDYHRLAGGDSMHCDHGDTHTLAIANAIADDWEIEPLQVQKMPFIEAVKKAMEGKAIGRAHWDNSEKLRGKNFLRCADRTEPFTLLNQEILAEDWIVVD